MRNLCSLALFASLACLIGLSRDASILDDADLENKLDITQAREWAGHQQTANAVIAQRDGDDIFSGAFGSGIDGTFNVASPGILLDNTIDFPGTSVMGPEPRRASLLGLGLIALIVAARRGFRS